MAEQSPQITPEMTTAERDKKLLPQGMDKPILSVVPEASPDGTLATATDPDQVVVKDVPAIMSADIDRQRGSQITIPALQSQFNAVVDSPNLQAAIQANNGSNQIAGLALSEGMLTNLKSDDAFYNETLSSFISQERVPVAEPDKLVVPGEYGLPDEVFEGADYEFKQTIDGIVATNKKIRDALQTENPYFGLDGKRMIMSQFAVGNTYSEAVRMISNLPGDVARTPYIGPMAIAGIGSLADAAFSERAFGDVLPSSFNQRMAESGYIQGSEKLLSKSELTESREASMQKWYKKTFIKTYGQDEWNRQHTEPMIQLIAGEDGTSKKDYIRDEETGQVKRMDVGLPPQVASAMVELAFDELPFVSKAGLLFSQQIGFTGAAVKLTRASSNRMMKRIDTARSDSSDGLAGMTDFQVFEKIRRNDFKETGNVVKKMFFGAREVVERTPGVGQVTRFLGGMRRKSKIGMGSVYRDMNANLKQFDDNISGLGDEIEKINEGVAPFAKNNVERRAILVQQQKALTARRNEYQKVVNKDPYMRAALRDEVLISASIGAAMTYLPDMSMFGVPSDMIAAITAPMITPFVVNGAARVTWQVGDSVTEGVFTDVAELLQNSDMFPFIPRDALVSGDERAMKQALQSQGFDMNDERVKAFDQFNRILRALPTENRFGENPRQMVIDSLSRYREMMQSYRTDLAESGMSPENLGNVMKRLNLSVAQASGLAPLIAYQGQKLDQVTSGKLVNSKDMEGLIRATADEQSLAVGIDQNIRIIRDMMKADGIELGDNSPLQGFISDLENGASKQKDALRDKQQALVLLFDQYTSNIANLNDDIDGTQVADMYKLATDLEKISILPEGTVARIVDEAQILNQVEAKMLESVRQDTAVLASLSHEMSEGEFIKASRRNADTLLDISYGRRRAEASVEYRKVDDLVGNRTFDLAPVIQKFGVLSGDMLDRPIASNMSDFGKFIRGDGKAVFKTFDEMAKRNLIKEFGFSEQDLNKALQQARQENPDVSYIDIAMDAIEAGQVPEAELSRLFSATFSEAEDMYRFFEIRAIGGKTDASEINKVKTEMRNLITNTYGDLSPEVKKQVEVARQTYFDKVGSRTDRDVNYAWLGPALASRVRKGPADRPKTEGPYGYKNIDRNHPEVAFLRMSEISTKLLNATDDVEVAALMRQLDVESDRVLYAIGGTRNKETDRIEFDLNDPSQEKALGIYQNLINSHLQYSATRDIGGRQAQAMKVLESPGTGGRVFGPDVGETLKFGRSQRMFEIEDRLAVDVIPKDGSPNQTATRRTVEFDNIQNFAIDFDDLLLKNKKWQAEYGKLREKLDPTKGVLTLAAKNEADDISNTIKTLGFDAQLVNKKETFFDVYFLNGNPASYSSKVDELVASSGLPKEEVEKAMRYMYAEGLFAKAKANTRVRQGKEQLSLSGEMFSQIVSDENQQKLMYEVLGKKHADSLIRMRDWVESSIGDSLDLRRGGVNGVITIDSAFSRIFNVARGMVSPLYVGTELASRTVLLYKQNLMDAALSDPLAAEAMAAILYNNNPSKQVIETLRIRLEAHLAKGVAASGNNIPSMDEILAQEENFRTYGTIINPITQEETDEDETVQ